MKRDSWEGYISEMLDRKLYWSGSFRKNLKKEILVSLSITLDAKLSIERKPSSDQSIFCPTIPATEKGLSWSTCRRPTLL